MKDGSGDKHDWNSLPKYIKKWRKKKKQGGSPFGLACGTVREKWNVQTMKRAAHASVILPLHWELLCYFRNNSCVQRIPQQGSLVPVLFLLKFPWELKAKASGDSGLLKWEDMLALKKKKWTTSPSKLTIPGVICLSSVIQKDSMCQRMALTIPCLEDQDKPGHPRQKDSLLSFSDL